jgi:hypothetical protein
MNPLNLITDPYDRQARLFPALLLISPVAFTAVALFANKLSGVQSLGATAAGLGGAFLLSQLARDAGAKHQKALFEKWGGMPSVAIFRHRHTRLDAITKARYHKKLSVLVKEAKAPTPEEEQTNPAAADTVYSAWSNFLRVNTRDKKMFSLLFQENVSYGYRRNVWGLRPIGITTSLLCLLVCGLQLYLGHQATGKLDEALVGAGAFAAILLLLWLFRFSCEWVRIPADAYAERLAECAEALGVRAVPAKDIKKK